MQYTPNGILKNPSTLLIRLRRDKERGLYPCERFARFLIYPFFETNLITINSLLKI